MAIRHALALWNMMSVKILVSFDGTGEWIAVVFDGEIPVDWVL